MRGPRLACILALALLALPAGCFGRPDPVAALDRAIEDCAAQPALDHVLYLGPSLGLQEALPPAGSAPGNAFSSAFLTDQLKEWLSPPVPDGLWVVGNVTLEFWARSEGTPAPITVGGAPGTGYHFFNQFGSDRGFQPSSAVEYSDVAPMAGAISHYVEVLPMPPGGFVIEAGDRVRLLLTDLTADGRDGAGHSILFGGGTPSQVRFTARCFPRAEWSGQAVLDQAVVIPANGGLLFGGYAQRVVEMTPAPAGVASDANRARFDVELPRGTQRVSISLEQTTDANPLKDDVDLALLDPAGTPVWSIGSPYADESGALWSPNLEAVFPDGRFTVEVDSYSGVAYQGTLRVVAEHAAG